MKLGPPEKRALTQSPGREEQLHVPVLWRGLARAGWLGAVALTVAIVVAGARLTSAQLQTVCVVPPCPSGQLTPEEVGMLRAFGLSPSIRAVYIVVLQSLFSGTWCLVGAVIFWRKSRDPMALLAAVFLVAFGGITFSNFTGALAAAHPVLWLPLQVLRFLGIACLILFLCLFPNGRFVPAWSRGLAAGWAAQVAPNFFFPGSPFDFATWPPLLALAVNTTFFGASIYLQVHRYRRHSSASEQQQTKWVVFGTALGIAGALAGGLADSLPVVKQAGPVADLGVVTVVYGCFL